MAEFSEDIKNKANQLKDEGNSLLADHKFNLAVEKYTQALELMPSSIFYSNRAQAYIKLEAYGFAIQDANSAIALDPSYVKAYYRRGSANFALDKLKEAKVDFQLVLKQHPNEADAKKKLNACIKAIREEALAAALYMEDQQPTSTEVLSTLVVDSSYTGPRLEDENGAFFINPQLVVELMHHYKDQKILHKKFMYELLFAARDLFSKEPTLMRISLPRDNETGKIGEITVCGDTHGQFYDLCNIFEMNGLPTESNPYLFNGDFVDRGSFSVEVVTTLIAWKLACPNAMFLTRGNHESVSMNRIYGFEGEVKYKYDAHMMHVFTEVFNWLPLAGLIENKIFVVHGGIGVENEGRISLESIDKISRNREPPGSGLMNDLLWADPHPGTGKIPSKRGLGSNFGSDYTKNFLTFNDLSYIIRSHEFKDEGYEVAHKGKCITIFSAPNYCDQMGNKGAYIRIGEDLQPNFTQFTAVSHPNIPAMRYASNMFGL